MDLGCGITFDIFTHVFTRVILKFIIIYTHKEEKKKYIVTIWKTDIMSSSYNEKISGSNI